MYHDLQCTLSCQPSCLHFRDQSLDLGILQPHQLLQLLDFCLYDLQHNSTNDLAQQRQGSLQLLCVFCTPSQTHSYESRAGRISQKITPHLVCLSELKDRLLLVCQFCCISLVQSTPQCHMCMCLHVNALVIQLQCHAHDFHMVQAECCNNHKIPMSASPGWLMLGGHIQHHIVHIDNSASGQESLNSTHQYLSSGAIHRPFNLNI